MTSNYIYKIAPEEEWEQAEQAGIFTGSAIDTADGFIHFSTAEQVAGTLALHFRAQSSLILAEIKTAGLDIIYEPARDGQLFPHLYATLEMSHVSRKWTLALDSQDVHILPSL